MQFGSDTDFWFMGNLIFICLYFEVKYKKLRVLMDLQMNVSYDLPFTSFWSVSTDFNRMYLTFYILTSETLMEDYV